MLLSMNPALLPGVPTLILRPPQLFCWILGGSRHLSTNQAAFHTFQTTAAVSIDGIGHGGITTGAGSKHLQLNDGGLSTCAPSETLCVQLASKLNWPKVSLSTFGCGFKRAKSLRLPIRTIGTHGCG